MFDIASMRLSSGMTQAEVSEFIGMSLNAYRSWETGRRMLSLEQACQLADLFRCSLDDLAGREFVPDAPPEPADETMDRVRAAYAAASATGRDMIAAMAEVAAARMPARR